MGEPETAGARQRPRQRHALVAGTGWEKALRLRPVAPNHPAGESVDDQIDGGVDISSDHDNDADGDVSECELRRHSTPSDYASRPRSTPGGSMGERVLRRVAVRARELVCTFSKVVSIEAFIR